MLPTQASSPLKLARTHIAVFIFLIIESKKLLHTQQYSTMMIKHSFVYLLLTLAACPGVTSQLIRSTQITKRVDNAAQRDQEALLEERHLQVEESMPVSANLCMSLEVGGIIQPADTDVAVEEAPIETPPEPTEIDADQDTSTAPTKAAKSQVTSTAATTTTTTVETTATTTAATKAAKFFKPKTVKRS